jgi:hypothetical protein
MGYLGHSEGACSESEVGNVLIWRVGFGKELRYHEIEDG